TAASHSCDSSAEAVSVYELNMGQPVKIQDLAERMIRLSGLEPNRDIEIVYTGIRPGARLHEFLSTHESSSVKIGIGGAVGTVAKEPTLEEMRGRIDALERYLPKGDRAAVFEALRHSDRALRSVAG